MQTYRVGDLVRVTCGKDASRKALVTSVFKWNGRPPVSYMIELERTGKRIAVSESAIEPVRASRTDAA